MIKRIFDFLVSTGAILCLLPVYIFISIAIVIDSKGGVFYLQQRIGKQQQPFYIFKFRTMYTDSDRKGLLTVGARDPRVTRVGYYLRNYKLDELPQLLNVWLGTMSFVGPRPEVKKYVDLYNEQQLQVLQVKPGITDLASLEYFHENELLAKSENPEQTYITEVMPAKLALNLTYIQTQSLVTDLSIIIKTVTKIIR